MRIIIWSTAPFVKTGYGKNCFYFIEALKEKHEVFVFPSYGVLGGSIKWNNTTVLSSTSTFAIQPEILNFWVKKLLPDLIIQHFDIWVLPSGFTKILEAPIISYSPIDSDPAPLSLPYFTEGIWDNVAMTKFTAKQLNKLNIPCSTTIPHCVDRNIFYPEDKKECKIKLGLPPESFIIGSVATNKGPRKNLISQLNAFAKFREKNDNIFFYLHCYLGQDALNPEGIDIFSYIEYLGIQDYVFYSDQLSYQIGLTEAQMRILYSAFDILTECSHGEGFGIPIIEAQACGTPVVGTDFSAIPEVIGEGGITIPVAQKVFYSKLGVGHGIPDEKLIVEAYNTMYNTDQEYWQKKSIENAKKYDFSIWKNNWLSYLGQI